VHQLAGEQGVAFRLPHYVIQQITLSRLAAEQLANDQTHRRRGQRTECHFVSELLALEAA
jgi:hypothetical protein